MQAQVEKVFLDDPAHTEDSVELNGVTICYRDSGPKDAPPIVLIMGLAGQLSSWPPEFIASLLDAGNRVITFDNREIGLSSLPEKTDNSKRKPPSAPRAFLRYKLGFTVASDYSLYDSANDTCELIRHLKLEKPVLLGVSMGGMIAQLVAAKHPELISRLILLMTSDNHPRLPTPSAKTLWRITGSGVKGEHQEAVIKRGLAFWNTVASPDYPASERRIVARIAKDYQRSFRPKSILRQMIAIQATGSIREESKSIKVQTLILHGLADKLVHPKAARLIHSNIEGSELKLIKGWGHDVPLGLIPEIVEHVQKFIET